MDIFIKAKLFSAFQKPDFTNKDTGEITKGKYILQLISERKLSNGENKVDLTDISVPASLVNQFKDKVGNVVTVPVGAMAANKSVIFYGVES